MATLVPHPAPRRSAASTPGAARQGPVGSAADEAGSAKPAVTAIAPLAGDAAADERLLAYVRFGAASALLAWVLTNTGPGHSAAVRWLTSAYALYSFLIVLVCRWRCERLLPRVNMLHAADFAWTSAASTVGGGMGSHAFIFFAFVVAAAAFRWDLKRALLNGALVLAIGAAQGAAAATGVTPWGVEFDVVLLPVSIIGIGMAILFGLLADRLHRARHQATVIASLVGSISRATGVREAVSTTLVTIARAVQAARVLAVVTETRTGGVTLWHAESSADRPTVSEEDVPRDRQGDWTAPVPLEARAYRRRAPDAVPVCTTPASEPADQPAAAPPLARGVLTRWPWRTLLAVPVNAGDDWTGHVYVMDPSSDPRRRIDLRFLDYLLRQATPGLINLYQLRRLRSRAEAVERARISRELHDTVNQSLAAIAMRLELVRRHAAIAAPRIAEEVAEVQPLLDAQHRELRQIVERLRREDLDARRLPGVVANFVERFARQGDIRAQLEWAVAQVELTPPQCREVARIVQEALFNVRRHSGASRVVVRVEADAGSWRLIVEDDGRGLGFTGRIAGTDLDLAGKTPRVIRDRVAALGGTLFIESSERGTRLEITFPIDGGLT